MVATESKNSSSWLEAAPSTPTTPVAKPSRGGSKNLKKNPSSQLFKKKSSGTSSSASSSSSTTATAVLPTAKRPDFHPPILASSTISAGPQQQKTPSVRFDLSGSQNSAFTAVEPRVSNNNDAAPVNVVVPKITATDIHVPARNLVVEEKDLVIAAESLTTPPAVPRPIRNTTTLSDQQEFLTPPTSSHKFTTVAPAPPRRKGKYTGPVDVDEVSLTSSFSSAGGVGGIGIGDETDDDSSLVADKEKGQEDDVDHGSGGSDKQDSSQLLTRDEAAQLEEPDSPDTPLVKNTSRRNWLANQKEPFLQQSGMMPSPPISMRHLMNSGKTLPEEEEQLPSSSSSSPPLPTTRAETHTTYQDRIIQPIKSTSPLPPPQHARRTSSPPISPLQLEESDVFTIQQMDSSTSPTTTSDVHLRLEDPASPPLSPFDIDSVGLHNDHQEDASSIRNKEDEGDPHTSMPLSTNAESPPNKSPFTEPRGGSGGGGTMKTSSDIDYQTKNDLGNNNSNDDEESDQGSLPPLIRSPEEIAATTMVEDPTSPPTIPRSSHLLSNNNNWLRDDKEPFQLEQMMQEEPMSPPISDSNLIVTTRRSIVDNNHDTNTSSSFLAVISPPTSPPSALEMTRTLLEELNQSQRAKQEQQDDDYVTGGRYNSKKRSKRRHKASSSRKREVYQQLHNAQQVVSIILRGANYADLDLTSPHACFEAIRHYAELKVEASKLTTQLEDSKQQLKTRYLEWKELRKDMMLQTPAAAQEEETTQVGTDHHDSMAILQQLLSDDDSVYKEDDDATNTVEEEEEGTAEMDTINLACNPSFSVSVNVDQEDDAGKAMDRLFVEMRSELENIRSAWQQEQSHHNNGNNEPDIISPTEENRDQPGDLDFTETSLEPEQLAKTPPVSTDVDPHPLEGNDSFLLAKIEELTAQIESMEQDRVALSGYMDHLAQEVIKTDTVEELAQKMYNPQYSLPESWTTFGTKFPIYRVRESEDEDKDEDDDGKGQEAPDEAAGACEETPTTDKMPPEIDCYPTTPSSNGGGAAETNYRPYSLLLRSRRFHASNDSDPDLLPIPINLPRSRGVSYERGELKQTLSEFSEDDIRSELQAKFAQPNVFQDHRTEDDDIISEGSFEKKIASMSFDSFFVRRRFSEPTSPARRKLHTTFLNKFKSRRRGEERTALLSQNDSILAIDNSSIEIPTLVVDPYSISASSPKPAVTRPPILDSELVQKLQAPELEVQLSLPRKFAATTSKDMDDASTLRPSSPQGHNQDNQDGYVRLCSKLLQTQEDLQSSKDQLKLLHKKHTQLMTDFGKVEQEKEKWRQLAISGPSDVCINSSQSSADSQSNTQNNDDSAMALSTLKEQSKDLVNKEREVSSQEKDEIFEVQIEDVAEKAKKNLEVKELEQEAMTIEIKELETQLTECQKALKAMDGQYKSAAAKSLEMEKRDSMTSMKVEVKLLEKAEECDRLTSQVQSLTEQLEKHMAKVAELELQIATQNQISKTYGARGNSSVVAQEDTAKPNVQHTDQSQIQDVAVDPFKILANELCESSNGNPSHCHTTSNSVPSSERSLQPHMVEDANASIRGDCQSPISSPKQPTKRTSGRGRDRASGRGGNLLRGLFNKKRFTISSPRQEKPVNPYASMRTHSAEEDHSSPDDRRISCDDIAGGDSRGSSSHSGDQGLGGMAKPNSGSDSLDDSLNTSAAASSVRLQSKTSMDPSDREDAQLATIHVLTKRIEELQEENSMLKSTLGRTGIEGPKERAD